MKKYLLGLMVIVFSLSLMAQIPELPPILQEKFEQEKFDLSIDIEQIEYEKTEEQYYKFLDRDEGSDTLLGYQWNRIDEAWVLYARIIKNYDDLEILSNKYFQYLNDAGEWVDGLYFTYSYTDSGKLSEVIIQHWNPVLDQWMNYFKKTRSFNDSDNIISCQTQWWKEDAQLWILHQLKSFNWNNDLLVSDTLKINHPMNDMLTYHNSNTYTYNDLGLKTDRIFSFYNHFIQEWVAFKKFNYNYDDLNLNIIDVVAQKWFGDMGWKNVHKYNYVYNENDKVIDYLFEYWNATDELWIERVNIEYEYDANGYLSYYLWKHRPFDAVDWKNVKQVFFTNSDQGNMTDMLEQHWHFFEEEWVNLKKWEIILDLKTITSINDQLNNKVKARFNNPYGNGDQIVIEGLEDGTYEIQIFDASGRIVEVKSISNNDQFVLSSDLKNGMYIMLISRSGNALLKSKIIVTK